MADVGTFIAEAGLGGLLDVKSAMFEGSLQATSGGSVSLQLSVSFMQGQPQSLPLAFNFQSPLAAAEDSGSYYPLSPNRSQTPGRSPWGLNSAIAAGLGKLPITPKNKQTEERAAIPKTVEKNGSEEISRPRINKSQNNAQDSQG